MMLSECIITPMLFPGIERATIGVTGKHDSDCATVAGHYHLFPFITLTVKEEIFIKLVLFCSLTEITYKDYLFLSYKTCVIYSKSTLSIFDN